MYVPNSVAFMAAVFVSLMLPVHGRIKVMSTVDDETVYTLREKPIITNIDSPKKGFLVLASPSDACERVKPPPSIQMKTTLPNTNETAPLRDSPDYEDFSWILLVSWSENDDCSLRKKAESASLSGYSVLLLQDPSTNDNDSEPFLAPLAPLASTTATFDYGWTSANVYASTINPLDWELLKQNFTTDQYYLSFEDPNSMSGWFTYVIVGVLAIGGVFFTIGLSYVLVQLLVLILYWIRESIVSRIQQIRRDRRRRLPASQLKKIPIQQWNSDMLQDICSICLETFEVADKVRILPCSHVFHQICIDPWLLKQRRKCPNCKRKIVFPDENRDSDSSSDDERTPLLRRTSSTREVNPRVVSQHQIQRVTEGQNNVGSTARRHPFLFSVVGAASTAQGRRTSGEVAGEPYPQPITSNCSINSTQADTLLANQSQSDLKEKVDELCARMENVGKKIKKKVKANQASKADTTSADPHINRQPVYVAVTVESNQIQSDNDEENEQIPCESPSKQQPSGDTNETSDSLGESQPSTSCHFPINALQVRVVPESSTSSSLLAAASQESNIVKSGESSISSNSNA